ncbi:ATP-binding protein [Streptomyces ochraceiscleroticus]|uniref:ATP-binding protein n=1 Tax=Streptomyces ochraceiscleroticus TaxID=47761 RepID=A0ABW1MKQ3_9ACTN|nr:ATP-binding protein [Streptomyces ochraceiscleroticus]
MKEQAPDPDLADSAAERPELPRPSWLTAKDGWRYEVTHPPAPPDLATCPPMGTRLSPSDPRLRYHATMATVETPAILLTQARLRQLMWTGGPRTEGRLGMAIDGLSGTGKSRTMFYAAQAMERGINTVLPKDTNRIPVVAINVPPIGTGGTRPWAQAISSFIGDPPGNPAHLTRTVCTQLRRAQTKVLLIDGVESLALGGDAEQAFDFLRYIRNETGVFIVYCGEGSARLLDAAVRGLQPSTAGGVRHPPASYAPVVRTRPFPRPARSPKDLWRTIVKTYDGNLRLFQHQPDDLTRLAEELWERTRGYLGALSYLVCSAAQEAIYLREERITLELLDRMWIGRPEPDTTTPLVVADSAGGAPEDEDAQAGGGERSPEDRSGE